MSLNEDLKIPKEECEEYEFVIKDLQDRLEVMSKTNKTMEKELCQLKNKLLMLKKKKIYLGFIITLFFV
uniref:Uncharacterized protein n=1 Tax=Manihot esculenta TaxID=3983 RepID=A0A2C9V1T7_MANES